jgi:hypothetical protein
MTRWALHNPKAQEMAQAAVRIVRERMRAEDMWCYLFRLLDTLGGKMDFEAQDPVFDRFTWNDITEVTVQTYEQSSKWK